MLSRGLSSVPIMPNGLEKMNGVIISELNSLINEALAEKRIGPGNS